MGGAAASGSHKVARTSSHCCFILPVEGTNTISLSSAYQGKVQLTCVWCLKGLKQNMRRVFAALRDMDDKRLGTSSLGTKFCEW